VDHDRLCALVLAELARSEVALPPGAPPAARRRGWVRAESAALLAHGSGTQVVVPRATEQANLVLGMTGITATDERRYAMSVLNAVLGGGMSSRLFQEVREKRGLAYSVYSFAANYADSGYFGLYAGCTPAKVDEVVDLLRSELGRLAQHGITDAELTRGIGQMRGSMVLGMEDTGSRMTRLGKAELVYGEYTSVDGVLAGLESVTAGAVQELAKDLMDRPRSLALVGPFEEHKRFLL
ncbi:MAG: M16 family metallopeptidase, partial [Angustibacter sp.]